jgi:hypothetical protein
VKSKLNLYNDALPNTLEGQPVDSSLEPHRTLMGDIDKDVRTDKDVSTEIFFEAHAPKIIIPQEMSSDGGYLLLDTGYLVVKGRMGGAGMSWDISLRYSPLPFTGSFTHAHLRLSLCISHECVWRINFTKSYLL